eukprot:CAMPEP_0183483542 /NCGR_PEP_ID=MMETSP0370-20130417/178449_1 /TAXON_ID=268820 /ORGANISM="Peridinium aciculiferum, Strain PAER-2" /LENGTH=42 /DNA_ID= /DNA_START= /DNA_END= /DNA_ORIENTATION=
MNTASTTKTIKASRSADKQGSARLKLADVASRPQTLDGEELA